MFSSPSQTTSGRRTTSPGGLDDGAPRKGFELSLRVTYKHELDLLNQDLKEMGHMVEKAIEQTFEMCIRDRCEPGRFFQTCQRI